MSQNEVTLELSRGPEAPASARQAIAAAFDGGLDRETLFNVRAVVSGLVANSVRSDPGPVRVRVWLEGESLQGEVEDGGGGSASLRERGNLPVIDGLTRHWGIDGARAWFAM